MHKRLEEITDLIEQNIVMYSLPSLLTSFQNKDFKEDIFLTTKVLCDFFVENNLFLNFSPYDEYGKIREDLEIKSAHLTVEGFKLFLKPVNNWFSSHGRGAPIEKTTILEKGLTKIRNE